MKKEGFSVGVLVLALVILFTFVFALESSTNFDTPDNNSFTNTSTPNFNFTISGTNETYFVTLRIDEKGNGTTIAVNGTTTNITSLSSLVDGTYLWSFNVTNGSYTNTSSYNRTINVDTTYPQVNLTTVSVNNGTYRPASTLPINYTVNETNTANITIAIYYFNGSAANVSVLNSNEFYLNYTLDDGSYVYNVSVMDNATNKNTTVRRTVYIDTTVPVLTHSVSPSEVTSGEEITLACTSDDALEGSLGVTTTIKLPDTDDYVSVSTGGYTPLLVGTYIFRCESSDSAGNTQSEDIEFSSNSASSGSSSSSSSSSGGSSSSSSDDEEETDSEVVEDGEETEDSGSEAEDNNLEENSETWENDGLADFEMAAVGDVYTFSFEVEEVEEIHTVTLIEVNIEAQKVVLIVESEPQEVTLLVKETEQVDVNQDGVMDLLITLNTINEDGTASISFEKMGEWASESKSNTKIIVALIVIFILLLLSGWYLQKQK